MKNATNDRNKINKLDGSFDKYKYHYQKKNEKPKKNNDATQSIYSMNHKINNNNNNSTYHIKDKNKTNINKKNNINEVMYKKKDNKLNLLHVQHTPNKLTKNNLMKYTNTPARRDCHTPDKTQNNLKYNFGLSTNKKDNKHNISLLKTNTNNNNQRNNSFIEYHYKNSANKLIIRRSKSKNNNLLNESKKGITPDRLKKTRNIRTPNNYNNLNNKKTKEPIKKQNYVKNKMSINFTKSYNNNINSYNNTRFMESNEALNYSSYSNQILKDTWKRKTPDK